MDKKNKLISSLRKIIKEELYKAHIKEFEDVKYPPISYRPTYKELLGVLQKLTPEQLNMEVTIMSEHNSEFMSAVGFGEADKEEAMQGILDMGHPYIVIQ